MLNAVSPQNRAQQAQRSTQTRNTPSNQESGRTGTRASLVNGPVVPAAAAKALAVVATLAALTKPAAAQFSGFAAGQLIGNNNFTKKEAIGIGVGFGGLLVLGLGLYALGGCIDYCCCGSSRRRQPDIEMAQGAAVAPPAAGVAVQ